MKLFQFNDPTAGVKVWIAAETESDAMKHFIFEQGYDDIVEVPASEWDGLKLVSSDTDDSGEFTNIGTFADAMNKATEPTTIATAGIN